MTYRILLKLTLGTALAAAVASPVMSADIFETDRLIMNQSFGLDGQNFNDPFDPTNRNADGSRAFVGGGSSFANISFTESETNTTATEFHFVDIEVTGGVGHPEDHRKGPDVDVVLDVFGEDIDVDVDVEAGGHDHHDHHDHH